MIDFKALQKLRVQDGDLLVVPESTEQDDMQLLAESIQIMLEVAAFSLGDRCINGRAVVIDVVSRSLERVIGGQGDGGGIDRISDPQS
ncbi:hypothetical protein B5P22_31215 [Pseudomonas tolaasii]|uniref:hypothetical protein n=1 Tax=Pseudomonas tolaasii TaxID=29442 RepID=UPI0009B69437|nr:hypothetical protein [Pseudomonas tolaasii]ARB31578.1 hypothetical protein B5P22_31215 [Pseudomonas tolaasii]